MKKRVTPKSKSSPSKPVKADKLVVNAKSIKDKLLKYALNPEHDVGKHKAAYFASIGFTSENWEELAEQLLFDPDEAEVTEENEYGVLYNQVIEVVLPDKKRTRRIKTAWINDVGTNQIRLTTCYPD